MAWGTDLSDVRFQLAPQVPLGRTVATCRRVRRHTAAINLLGNFSKEHRKNLEGPRDFLLQDRKIAKLETMKITPYLIILYSSNICWVADAGSTMMN